MAISSESKWLLGLSALGVAAAGLAAAAGSSSKGSGKRTAPVNGAAAVLGGGRPRKPCGCGR